MIRVLTFILILAIPLCPLLGRADALSPEAAELIHAFAREVRVMKSENEIIAQAKLLDLDLTCEKRLGVLPEPEHYSADYAGTDILSRTRDLEKIQKIMGTMHGQMVDIGSAYSFPGFYFTTVNSGLSYLGLEFVPAKVQAAADIAKRLGLPVYSVVVDVAKNDLPDAEYYYLYNPVSEETLADLYVKFSAHQWGHAVYLIQIANWFHDPPPGFTAIHSDQEIVISRPTDQLH